MSSDTTPRVWTHDDAEPPMIPDPPPMRDKYGVRWVADEREDGFEGWRSDSHGFRVWRVWFNLAHERGPLTEDLDGVPYRLDLPWPRPPLNHNDRLHRMTEARIKAEVRETVGWIAKAAKIPPARHIIVQLHYAPGRRGKQDGMNWARTTKPAVDGIVDAGIVSDDDTEHVTEMQPAIHFPPEPGPRCWLTIKVVA